MNRGLIVMAAVAIGVGAFAGEVRTTYGANAELVDSGISFSPIAYDLPNERVCLETCAAIANAFFNERMFLRTGESKYLDIVERIAYNGSLCSISISGDEFFYPNPMASRGGYKRSKWFGCACCPPNVVRFIPQFIDWAYASDAKSGVFYWNFFIESLS